jgi:hypothetical protein
VSEFHPDDLSPNLKNKSRPRQADLVDAILEANQAGRFSLSETERRELRAFVGLARQSRPVSDDLLRGINRIVRNYEQYLIALASK